MSTPYIRVEKESVTSKSLAQNMNGLFFDHQSNLLTQMWKRQEQDTCARLLEGTAQILRDINLTNSAAPRV